MWTPNSLIYYPQKQRDQVQSDPFTSRKLLDIVDAYCHPKWSGALS